MPWLESEHGVSKESHIFAGWKISESHEVDEPIGCKLHH